MFGRGIGRILCVSIMAAGGLVSVPLSAYADTCSPGTEAAVGTRVDVEVLEYGVNQPEGSEVSFTLSKGQSFEWGSTTSVGAVAGYGSSSFSVDETNSSSVTYISQIDRTFSIDLGDTPGAVRADLMVPVHVASYGWRDTHEDCSASFRWDREEATPQEPLGFRLVKGDDTEVYNWPTIDTPTVTGTF